MVKLILETHVGPISQRVILRRDDFSRLGLIWSRNERRYPFSVWTLQELHKVRVFTQQIKLGMIADNQRFRGWKMLVYIFKKYLADSEIIMIS